MAQTTMEETTDYEIFKLAESNRDINPKHVARLGKAMEKKNLLKSHPIVVNKDMLVIDGQHRLEAAKKLQIPVTYIIDENLTKADMISMNSNVKVWTVGDYLNYYLQEGNKEYECLQAFMETYELPVNIAIQLLNGCRSTPFFREFKDGKYKFPTSDEVREVENKIMQIDHIINFIKKKTSGIKTYLDKVTFYGALVDFFNIKSFDFDIFMTKLQYKLDYLRPCSKQGDYLRMFKEIYNWKNKNPLQDIPEGAEG